MRKSWIQFAIVLSVVTTAALHQSQARAQTATREVRRMMEQGQSYYLQGRFNEAAFEFENAYKVEPFAAFLFNAGVAYESGRNYEPALASFQKYIGSTPEPRDSEQVRERMQRIRDKIAEIERLAAEAAQQGTAPAENTSTQTAPSEAEAAQIKSLVSIVTNPPNAKVTLLQRDTVVAEGPTPFNQSLENGEYLMKISHPQFRTIERAFRVESGKVYEFIAELSQGQFLGFLRISANVDGALVYIGERREGLGRRTPYEAPFPVGEYPVWIEKPGYETIEEKINVQMGETIETTFELKRVSYGRIRISCNIRGAKVSIDGKEAGVVSERGFESQVEAGSHRVKVASDGMKDLETSVSIAQGQVTPLRVRLRPAQGRAGAWVALGLSAASLGGGIVLSMMGDEMFQGAKNDLSLNRLNTQDPRLETGLYLWIGADAAYGVSALLFGLSIYYFLVDNLPPSEGRILESRDWTLLPAFESPLQPGTSFTGLQFQMTL